MKKMIQEREHICDCSIKVFGMLSETGYSAQEEWTAFDSFKENPFFVRGGKELKDQVQIAEVN